MMPDMSKAACTSFQTVPECKPADVPIAPLKGSRQVVISSLAVADFSEGFDLNCDGKVDNKLAPLGAVANSDIANTFAADRNIIIPIELFGYNGADSECSKFAFYLGRVNEDKDMDGADTTWKQGRSDCDDTNKDVHPGMPEKLGNFIDDDCDGYADNAKPGVAPSYSPAVDGGVAVGDPTVNMDLDGDGQSRAQGDCDDRAGSDVAKARKHGGVEICGNGIDDDCNGIADDGDKCDVFGDNTSPVHVQALSFSNAPANPMGNLMPDGLKPFIVFGDGSVKSGTLNAGPDLFQLALPISGFDLTLTLSGARVKMKLTEKNGGTYVDSGVLGGVLQAITLAQIHIAAGGILKKEQSLLDGIFVGAAGVILGLDVDKDGHYLPDIDVDGDGVETFWQDPSSTTPTDAGAPLAIIDRCKDGDGTVYNGADCPFTCKSLDGVTLMKGAACMGKTPKEVKFLFVDGLSAAIKFKAVPAKLADITPK